MKHCLIVLVCLLFPLSLMCKETRETGQNADKRYEEIVKSVKDNPGQALADLKKLADKNRFALLPEIVRQFRLLELRDSGEGLCVFRCAREPDDESLRSLAKLLCARHSYCAVTFEIVQDDTLLGGFTAEIDGVTYDKSVRGQLRALAHDL